MILTPEQYKACLPANTLSDTTKLDAFETRALYKHLLRFLGQRLTDYVASSPDPGDDGNPPEIILKVAPALANLAYLESIPFYNLILMSSGFGVVSNQNVAPASMDRVRDLKDACLQAANHGIDQLLAWLEGTDDGLSGSDSVGEYFSQWNQCSINSGSLIETATAFNDATKLYITRVQFIELMPHIRNIETTHIAQALSTEFLEELVEGDDTLVKPLVANSLALLAWASFQRKQLEQDPPQARALTSYEMQAKALLKRALSLLRSNLATYPTYETYGYEAPYDNASIDNEESGFFIAGITG